MSWIREMEIKPLNETKFYNVELNKIWIVKRIGIITKNENQTYNN